MIPDWLSPKDVAVLLHVSVGTVYKWIRQGRLRAIKLGKYHRAAIRISRRDLDAFIERSAVGFGEEE